MVQCKLCGYTFDENEEGPCSCPCGCGDNMVLCPNCGYEIRLYQFKKDKTENNASNSLIGFLRQIF